MHWCSGRGRGRAAVEGQRSERRVPLLWPASSSRLGLPSSSWSEGGCQLAEAEIAELSNKRCLTFRSEMCLHPIVFLSNAKLPCSGKPWALCPRKRQRDSLSSSSSYLVFPCGDAIEIVVTKCSFFLSGPRRVRSGFTFPLPLLNGLRYLVSHKTQQHFEAARAASICEINARNVPVAAPSIVAVLLACFLIGGRAWGL